MNIVNKLTLKHMRMNKRRTFVTIIGVIISAAMITAVTALPISFMDMMARDAIARDGLWHTVYYEINSSQLKAIQKDENTASVSIMREVGYAELEAPKSQYKPFLYIQELNHTAFENYHIELTEGRLPENNSELVVTRELLEKEDLPFGLSDTVTLQVGKRYAGGAEDAEEDLELGTADSIVRDETTGELDESLKDLQERTYTVVGVMETPIFEYSYHVGYNCISGFDEEAFTAASAGSGEAQGIPGGAVVNAYVELSRLDSNVYEQARQLALDNGISENSFGYHYSLLRYEGVLSDGSTKETLVGLAAIIMMIIIIGSVSLIYNAFAISVSERFRHLGMLASVGATARQKKNSVFFEGFVIGVISIPLGIFFGLLGIEITFRVINPTLLHLINVQEGLQIVFSWKSIGLSALLSALTIFISVYIPARRASRVTPIEAIRQTADVKITKKMVRTSRLTEKLFGVEGTVALKNLKRNKRRYKATIFSLVVSLVLFLTVSYFGESLRGANEMTMSGITYDTYVRLSSAIEEPEADQLAEKIGGMKYVESLFDVQMYSFVEPVDSGYQEDVLIVLGDDCLREYAKEVGLSDSAAAALFDTETNQAIAVNEFVYRDQDTGKFITEKIFSPEKNAAWTLYKRLDEEQPDQEEPELTPAASLQLIAYTDQMPQGASYSASRTPRFVVSQQTARRIFAENGGDSIINWSNSRTFYLQSSNPELLFAELEALDEEQSQIYIYSIVEVQKQEERMLLLADVFVYGFITLITLICVANIFNTISTSIMLRKREFAMLRSVGMTMKGFNRMIRYESIFYGLKALLYGLPISFVCMFLLYRAYAPSFDFSFALPLKSIGIAVLAVFLIVFVTMLYASSKIKRENIVESLRQEVI